MLAVSCKLHPTYHISMFPGRPSLMNVATPNVGELLDSSVLLFSSGAFIHKEELGRFLQEMTHSISKQ